MILSRTPLRVSFFGGGTDLAAYYEHDYGCVLSTSIDQYVYVVLNKRSFDNKIFLKYRLSEIVDSVDQILHPTIRESLKFLNIKGGVEIGSLADIPAYGTGLGSSSSFLVGVLNALYKYIGTDASAKTLAENSCKIEIDTLKEPIGKQDQYCAAYGGFNLIKFYKGGKVEINPLKTSPNTLESLNKKLLFFYTGLNRKASQILKHQKRDTEKKIDTLHKMKSIAEKAYSELLHNRFESFGDLLHESWLAKKSLAQGISNDLIDNYYSLALGAGAKGGKVLGAGGGGFLMFYCEEEKQAAVKSALRNLKEIGFNFSNGGSKIVYVESEKYSKDIKD